MLLPQPSEKKIDLGQGKPIIANWMYVNSEKISKCSWSCSYGRELTESSELMHIKPIFPSFTYAYKKAGSTSDKNSIEHFENLSMCDPRH